MASSSVVNRSKNLHLKAKQIRKRNRLKKEKKKSFLRGVLRGSANNRSDTTEDGEVREDQTDD